MRLILGLFLLLAAGVAVLTIPFQWVGLPPPGASGVYRLWYLSITAFAVPGCLFLLLMTRRNLIRSLCLIWGLWIAILTLVLLFQSAEALPMATSYGLFLIATTAIAGLTTFLFALQALGK